MKENAVLNGFRKWIGRYQYALLVVALGIFLMLLPAEHGEERGPEPEDPGGSELFDLNDFEARLEEVLSRIRGAGPVRAVLTLDSGTRQILAQDTDGESRTAVTVGTGGGRQEVVPLQQTAPGFRGALIVCPGGGDPEVRLKLTQAVTALTGLRADRISVCEGTDK